MAKNLTPDQIAEKYERRAIAGVQDMIRGVNQVTEAPTKKAVAKKDKLVNNWNNAIQSGKWERGMNRVTLDDWKASMVNKGAPRVAAGVQGARGKMVEFYGELLPYQAQMQSDLAKMPDLTLEDSIARASFAIRRMSEFRKRGR
jgi:hypothetical protein